MGHLEALHPALLSLCISLPLLVSPSQEKEAHLLQVYITRVAKAADCDDRDFVEGWIMGDWEVGEGPDLAGMTLEQVQQMDISNAAESIKDQWQEVSQSFPVWPRGRISQG